MVIASHSSRALQNRFWTSCDWAWLKFFSFNVKYPNRKLNSRDVLSYIHENYQLSFLSNFGKLVVILSLLLLLNDHLVCCKNWKLLRSTRDQDCLSHVALLHTVHYLHTFLQQQKRSFQILFLSNFYLFWILWKDRISEFYEHKSES